jgi:hypothetical protein
MLKNKAPNKELVLAVVIANSFASIVVHQCNCLLLSCMLASVPASTDPSEV